MEYVQIVWLEWSPVWVGLVPEVLTVVKWVEWMELEPVVEVGGQE